MVAPTPLRPEADPMSDPLSDPAAAPAPTLAELEQASPFRDRHIGPSLDDRAKMLAVVGQGEPRRAGRRGGARVDPADRAARPRRTAHRGRGARRAARARRAQPADGPDDRAGLLGHVHADGRPAQGAREPGLVHRVHALPAGDQPGPAGGAAQLPDRRLRPDRAADRRREPARRGHRGRRGDDPAAPGQLGRRGVPGRRRHAPADDRRAAHPGRAAGHRPARRRT